MNLPVHLWTPMSLLYAGHAALWVNGGCCYWLVGDWKVFMSLTLLDQHKLLLAAWNSAYRPKKNNNKNNINTSSFRWFEFDSIDWKYIRSKSDKDLGAPLRSEITIWPKVGIIHQVGPEVPQKHLHLYMSCLPRTSWDCVHVLQNRSSQKA